MKSLFNAKYFQKITIFMLMFLILTSSSVFADISLLKDLDQSSDYAKQSIIDLSNISVMMGDENGNFKPNQIISRAEMVTILVRVLGLDITKPPVTATFKDVPKNHWAFPYVEAAYKAGIVKGISADMFGVNDLSNREQMAAMYIRALGISESNIKEKMTNQNINKLNDKSSISDWAKEYVEFAIASGLMKGTSDVTFEPKGFAKREQAAVVTHRFIGNKDSITASYVDTDDLSLKEITAFEDSVVMIETFDKNGVPIAQGSGFSIQEGLFMTNYHVLEGSSKFTITTNDGKKYAVEGIVKYDADVDMAIIKTKLKTDITPLKLGSKSMVSKGDQVVAIGNPLGLQNTISNGIVSGIRSFDYGYDESVEMIQITAPISPGSSGGALFNMKGYIVGITTATSQDGNQNFAVAIDHARQWLQELKFMSFEDIPVLDMSSLIEAYYKMSDKDIYDTIEMAFRGLEIKDLDIYMSTLHKFNPSYRGAREYYVNLFSNYSLDFEILKMEIVDKIYDAAEVEVSYRLKATGYAHLDMQVIGQYSMLKYNGEWKIYYAIETATETPKGDSGNAGSGSNLGDGSTEAPENEIDSNKGIKLSFAVTDSIMHPSKPIIYVTNKYNKKVYAYNYETNTTIEAAFELVPERLDFAGDEVYVTLLKGQHNYYSSIENQKGAIAILDSDSLQLKEQFDIDMDPFDIVVGKDGYIYITSGSGQHSSIKSYSLETKEAVSSAGIYSMSYAALHPTTNKIYTITTGISPRDMNVYTAKDGNFTAAKDSPYHGEYAMNINFKISPDGSYVFNGAGTIFSSDPNKTDTIAYHSKLNKAFIDVAFDLANNKFYIGINNGLIYEYDYTTFKSSKYYMVDGDIQSLYHMNNKLIALTKTNSDYYLEIIDLSK